MDSCELYRIKAEENFLQGYNCTQSVVLAFSDLLTVDRETLLKAACSFGAGMGRLREVCGAVSGMFLVIGLLFGYTDPKDHNNKSLHYARVQELADEFIKCNGSIICREMLGLSGRSSPIPEKRTNEYYKKRPCKKIIGDAAEILAAYLQKNL